ncbi:MAG: hypothetical protein IRZ16_03040 [Myxococcaceae bacterium]|nr:hypothetical protein [Myxococcaceae bacterium]
MGSRKPPLLIDAAAGAIAGALGTWLMSPAQSLASKLQGASDQKREQQVSLDKNATELMAIRLGRLIKKDLQGDALKKAGLAVHYGYGALWGMAFALLSRGARRLPFAAGLALGASLWLLGDEIAVPALRLASGPKKYPVSSHLKALAAHLAYGAGVEGSLRLARRAGA